MSRGKKFKPWILVLMAFLFSNMTHAQINCGFDSYYDQLQNDPIYEEQLQLNEEILQQAIQGARNSQTSSTFNVEIPVIAHILHLNGEVPGSGNNISQSIIADAVGYLNSHFANSGIKFCLAKRYPNGVKLEEEGVVRINASNIEGYALSGMSINGNEFSLKNLGPQFSTFNYLNIWIVNNISSVGSNGQILGFAYFPNTAFDESLDGVTIMNNVLNSDWKILTHEVGHYFNLFHTFEGDDPGNDGIPPFVCPSIMITEGDKLKLTDAHVRPYSGTCPEGDNNCYDPAHPIENVVHNHMNYSSEICRTEFTADQIERMQCALLEFRPGIVNAVGCLPPCEPNFIVDFSEPSEPPVSGVFVNILNQTQGNNYLFSWQLNGVEIATTTHLNFSFPNYGTYNLCLRARNENGCINEVCKQIKVFQSGLCFFPDTTSCQKLLNGDFQQYSEPPGAVTTYDNYISHNHSVLFSSNLSNYNVLCNWFNYSGPLYVYEFKNSQNYFLQNIDVSDRGPSAMATFEPLRLEEETTYKVSFDMAVIKNAGTNYQCGGFYFGLVNRNDHFNGQFSAKLDHNKINKIKFYSNEELTIKQKPWNELAESDFTPYSFNFTYKSGMKKHLLFNELNNPAFQFKNDGYRVYVDNVKVEKCTPCIAEPHFTYQTDANCGITLTGTNSNNFPGFYTWDIECGPAVTGQMNGSPVTLTHTFPTAGTYEVCFTITCGENTSNQYCQTITIQGKCFNCTPIEIAGKAMKCPTGESILSNLTFDVPIGFRPCRENNICFSTNGDPATTLSYVVTSSTTNTSSETISISFALDDAYTNGNDWLVLCGPNGEAHCYSFELNVTECRNCITLYIPPPAANCVDNNPFDNLNHFAGSFTIPPGILPNDAQPCGSVSTQADFNSTPTNANGVWTVPFTVNTNNNSAVNGQSTLCFMVGNEKICLTINFTIPAPCPEPPTDCIQSWTAKPTGKCEVEGDFLKFSFNMTAGVGLNFSNLHICDFGLQAIVAGGGHAEVAGTPTVLGSTFSFNLNIYMPCDFDQTKGPYEMRLYLCNNRNEIVCLYFLLSFPPCEFDCGDRGSMPRNTSTEEVLVYPNPSTNSIFVDINKPKDLVYKLQIIDHVGKVLYELKTDQEHNLINTTTFSNGLKFVKVIGMNNKVISVNKFIKIE